MLVYLECYCYLLGQHSQFSILHFAQIFCHHNTFAWHYKSADHSFFQPSTFKFLLVFVHFFLSWSDCKNSFLQWHKNSLTMCWTCLHLLWLYKSGLEKSPGDGKIIFDFMVKMIDGDRDKLLVRSLVLSVVKGREFKIPSLPLALQVIPHQVIYHVFASEKKWWSRLNGSDPLKHHPYGWHKEGSFSK